MTRQIGTAAWRRSRGLQACALMLGLLAMASCSKAALMAPTASTLTLLTNRTSVGLSSTVTVTALVYESSGTPVHDGTVVTFYTTLGTMNPAQATTTNGQAVAQLVTGTESGVAEITANSGGIKAAASVQVTVGAAAVSRVELTTSSLAVPSTGGSALLTATVTDTSGNRLAGILVTYQTNAGTFDQGGGTTDANGQVQARLTTTSKATVTASVAGGTTGAVVSNAVVISLRTPPNAAVTTVASGLEVTLFYTAFEGADGAAISSVSLSFGDGQSQSSLPAGANQSITHVYASAGTYTVILTVIDVAGERATAVASVVVVP